ncbi:MAG: hypothetical protein C0514_06435 [Candidatus Puniceispirillum sp.]|nr:hypothetical protein [Candidatus Puniceispirillum sp.]
MSNKKYSHIYTLWTDIKKRCSNTIKKRPFTKKRYFHELKLVFSSAAARWAPTFLGIALALFVGATLGSLIYHRVHFDGQKSKDALRVQHAYEHIVEEIKEHLTFVARLSHTNTLHKEKETLQNAPLSFAQNRLTYLPNEHKSGLSADANDICFYKAFARAHGTLVLKIPLEQMARKLGLKALSVQKSEGILKTEAGNLYYPYQSGSFWESFVDKRIPPFLVFLACAYGFMLIIFCVAGVTRARARFEIADELDKLQQNITHADGLIRSMGDDMHALKKTLTSTQKAQKLLSSLSHKRAHRQAQAWGSARSLATLVRHVSNEDVCLSQIDALMQELHHVLVTGQESTVQQDVTHIDVPQTLARVFAMLEPFMDRARVTCISHVNETDFPIEADPYLFELCLLILCKDLVFYSLEGARVVVSSCEGALCLALEGNFVNVGTTFGRDTVDLGFMGFPRDHIPQLVSSLGMTLYQTKSGFALFLCDAPHQESASHDTVIPLFA